MSTTVSYKGNTLTTVDNETKTLLTSGKYLEDDITLVDVTSGGGGGKFKSGIYAENGYIYISPDPGAGGVGASTYLYLSRY